MAKNKLFFLSSIIFILMIVGVYVFAQQQNPGHSWSQMDCDGTMCVDALNKKVTIGTNPTDIKVGIGTTSPGDWHLYVNNGAIYAQGEIRTSSRLTGPEICFNPSDPNSCKTSWPSGGGGSLWTQNGTSIYYDAGNVGIGTTSPGAKLDVVGGNIRIDNLETRGTNIEVGNLTAGNKYSYIDFRGDDTYTDYGLRLLRGNGGANTYSELVHRGTGELRIKTSEAAPLLFQTSNTTRMYITSGGNVGIGTTSPEAKLEVNGHILQQNGNYLQARNSSGNIETWMWPRWTDNIMYTNFGSGGWNIRNNSSTSVMFLTNGGNVGIGTTSPGYRLDVSGNTRFFGQMAMGNTVLSNTAWLKISNGTSGYDSIYVNTNVNGKSGIYSTASCTAQWCYAGYFQAGSNARPLMLVGLPPSSTAGYMRVGSDGTVYYDSSSIKTKTNVRPLVDNWYNIFKLQPKTFIDKSTGDRGIGYIAEELDAIGLKNLVVYNKGEITSINYDKISLYLIEIIKDQQKRIEQLENKLK